MKKKRTVQLRHGVASTRRISVSAFFNLRASIALLICGAATCSILSGALLGFFRPEAPAKTSHPAAAGLTFAERIAYQRAIEEVYWRHRIWPRNRGERPDPKPSLDVVMSQAQLEKKVQNHLRESQALEDYWQKPIAPEQLQAEMERMARNTKQPEVLRELFEALGNDPSVIAECLARPVLAERLVADLSAHEKGRRFALLRTQVSGSKFSITTSGKATYTLPEIDPCTDDTWTPTSVTNAAAARRWHTAVWTGSEMIVWGGYGSNGSNLNTGGRYNPSTDSWTATSTDSAPAARNRHTAVWTGSKMIVWGGYVPGTGDSNTGGRYSPGTDSWTATNTTNAPDAREVPTAVWTGSEMIVWGGIGSSGYLNTGGRYCAQSGAPSPTPTATPCASIGAWTEQASYPIATSGHAVVSVGGNVYSFGGIVNNAAITNAYKYSPATNTWTPIAPLPAPRGWFSGASDGTYIYLLGGVDQNFNTTATLWRYDPASNTYNTSLPSYTIPTYFHACAYLNGKIYRIAGAAIGTDFHVEVYDIATNTWSMAANYPFANHNLMAVALGSYIYAGGGNASPDKTYRYDPSTDTWDDAAVADFPAGRSSAASGAYNGKWLLAGGDVNFATSNSAIAWDPATNTWNDLPNMVQARDNLEGATAGQSFYAVAGDFGPGNPTNDNQQYTEVCATSTPTPTATATATSTSTPTATPTPTPTATSTATPIATATFTPTPTATFTPTPTATFTPTTTPTLTPRPSPTPRVAPTPRPRPTPPPRP